MSEDWFVALVDEVSSAGAGLQVSVDRVVEQLAGARHRRQRGADLVTIVSVLVEEGGRDARLRPTSAFDAFERSITRYRACVIRHLVDDEGMTFTEIGRLTGVSRQMVARLYRQVG